MTSDDRGRPGWVARPTDPALQRAWDRAAALRRRNNRKKAAIVRGRLLRRGLIR